MVNRQDKQFVHPSRPDDLFEYESNRFVGKENDRQLLMFVDGACINNGSRYARAGWAVCVGPNTVFKGRVGRHPDGPSGQTNNRAELQSAITALRLSCWRRQGFDRVVIASDSEYVVKGYCSWLSAWERRNWFTVRGYKVKNQDLWKDLDNEVRRLEDEEVDVFFWRIPREWNRADKYARQAARFDS